MVDDQVDQYEQDHAAKYRADDAAREVLSAVADRFRAAKHPVMVGPFDDHRVCEVQITDPEDWALPRPEEPLQVAVAGGKRNIVVRTILGSPPVPFSGILSGGPGTPPQPPSGPSMGGDAIWQANEAEYGTVAFFANTLTISLTHSSSGPAPQHTNAALSCRHVLAGLSDVPAPASVSMVDRPDWLQLNHKAADPLDAATALIGQNDQNKYHYCQIRALGRIQGVRKWHRGMRVYKYGARTGLTTGKISHHNLLVVGGQQLEVFTVKGGFACVHDSGAAVVNDRRELVGMVFLGSTANCSFNTDTYVVAAASYTSNKSKNDKALFIEYQ